MGIADDIVLIALGSILGAAVAAALTSVLLAGMPPARSHMWVDKVTNTAATLGASPTSGAGTDRRQTAWRSAGDFVLRGGDKVIGRFLRDNGRTLVLGALFLLSLGQAPTGLVSEGVSSSV